MFLKMNPKVLEEEERTVFMRDEGQFWCFVGTNCQLQKLTIIRIGKVPLIYSAIAGGVNIELEDHQDKESLYTNILVDEALTIVSFFIQERGLPMGSLLLLT